MASQVTREYEAWDPTMAKYLDKVQTFMSTLEHFGISNMSLCENAKTNIPFPTYDLSEQLSQMNIH